MAENAESKALREHHRRRRRRTALLGFSLLVLSAVGAAALVTAGVKAAGRAFARKSSPTPDAAFFERYIAPVVMQDPRPFSNPGSLDQKWLMKTAIWAALNDGGSGSNYTADNRENLPVNDITAEIKKLFGNAVTLQYRSFTDSGASYLYQPAARCYLVPMISLPQSYSPRVTAVKKCRDGVMLTVQIIPGTGWVQNADGTMSAPAAVKTMEYRLAGSGTVYRIVSVSSQTTSPPAVASSGGSSGAGTGSGESSVGSPSSAFSPVPENAD